MSIGAVSLKPHHQYTKTNVNKAQSFAARREPDEFKNRTAAGIAISVGTTAALLIAGYVFRGKILNLPIFKAAKTFFNGLAGKAGQAKEKLTETVKNVGEKASGIKDDIAQKAKEYKDKAFERGQEMRETMQEVKETVVEKTSEFSSKAKEVGEKAYETSKTFIQETVEKAQETIKKLHK